MNVVSRPPSRRASPRRRPDRWPEVRASRIPQTRPKANSMPPPTEVADQVERRLWSLVGTADRSEGSCDRDVVHVVPGHLSHRTALAPAGHAAVDEAGVAVEAGVGADAEPFGHPWPEALDEGVGLLDQRQHRLHPVGVLQVDADRAAAAVHHVLRRMSGVSAAHRVGPVDAHHVGAHVGQHHGRERSGPDPGDLHHAHSGQRSHRHSFPLRRRCRLRRRCDRRRFRSQRPRPVPPRGGSPSPSGTGADRGPSPRAAAAPTPAGTPRCARPR